ncbi:hypothetical protein E2562_028333 [Oryza meyeriana var. granulata]|uniref:Uncharacterized protein n=1 Tax=Oryza meyeriana var. granulata TaxID=110450 RepID=A0A6G1FCX5_9ORYZ|nr:hypothetical protein E2562_028333 [Oryza meyeriana var. granulata]
MSEWPGESMRAPACHSSGKAQSHALAAAKRFGTSSSEDLDEDDLPPPRPSLRRTELFATNLVSLHHTELFVTDLVTLCRVELFASNLPMVARSA